MLTGILSGRGKELQRTGIFSSRLHLQGFLQSGRQSIIERVEQPCIVNAKKPIIASEISSSSSTLIFNNPFA